MKDATHLRSVRFLIMAAGLGAALLQGCSKAPGDDIWESCVRLEQKASDDGAASLAAASAYADFAATYPDNSHALTALRRSGNLRLFAAQQSIR
jgi:hypothetical protein